MSTPTVRPKVLHVITHLDLGGAESVAVSLAEALRDEFRFSFFAVLGVAENDVGRNFGERLARAQIPVFSGTRLEFKRGGAAHAAWRLNGVLRRVRPDVVHVHTEIPETTLAVGRFAFQPRARVLRTIHSSTPWPAWRRLGRFVERQLEDAEVTAVSHAAWQGWQDFRTSVGLSAASHPERVLYSGVRATPLGTRASSHDRPVRVLFAGRFEPEKGAGLLPAILDGARALTSRAVDVTLLGHGSLEGDLKRWADGVSAPWTARLSGPIPNLAAALGEYDVLVMPSRFEGLGIVAIEALLAGTPVVASDVPGLGEVFPAGYELLAEPNDVSAFSRLLARVVDDPQGYASVAARARSDMRERFGMEQMARRYGDVYRALAASDVPARVRLVWR
ncbi:glycosyltransferase family 4 protein [Deinococcus yavapaiensis]|uniref:Glycosyltransferase involved in cell wall biosynthesis n=1 Tax=Deinococcus yavapaiensis KR-236 TaxID=694435 RepID=A0A318SAY8_9DEIO|nr:glycosyltransferase family 4 protein [Deinococcus yavapaiensis]PYE55732.1 glycosyltransferase involved in cell wall biosynthesis [Deinococcus yavapaiensis KR-236]